MKTSFAPRLAFSQRIAAFLCLSGAAVAPALLADPLNCDLSSYAALPGLTAGVSGDVLTVTWTGAANTQMRARYAIDHGQPIVRELAIRAASGKWLFSQGQWSVLGTDLTPEFTVQTGHRRIDYAGLAPLRLLGIDITSKAVIEREAWVSFWDAPFVIPGDAKRNPGLPRLPSEVQRASGTFATSSCDSIAR